MGQLVKVKVRPGGSLQFPGICVHCSRPAKEWMAVRKRDGRLTRIIDVPLCADCYHVTRRLSGEEERLQRIGRVAAGATFLIALLVLLLIFPGGVPVFLRVLTALAVAIFLGGLVLVAFRRRQEKAILPEKRAVLESAGITRFSWRATTFEFNNEAFADRFVELNKTRLMEV